jgi:hypothetical protein
MSQSVTRKRTYRGTGYRLAARGGHGTTGPGAMHGRSDLRDVIAIEEVPEAVKALNRRIKEKDREGVEQRKYAKSRAKITLGAEITAWLNKKV